jgi:hypothetical protein
MTSLEDRPRIATLRRVEQLAASFQYEDPRAGARKPRRERGAAHAGADYHYVRRHDLLVSVAIPTSASLHRAASA